MPMSIPVNLHTDDIALFGQNENPLYRAELSPPLVSTFGWLEWTPKLTGAISNHDERTINLLIEQFRVDRPNINKFINSVAASCQEIENVLSDLLQYRSIAYATGIQLDRIGAIAGVSRTSLDDEIYRSDIYFQVYLNRSSGEPETLISALQRVTNAFRIDYCEPCPATVLLFINQAMREIPPDILVKMKALAAAGVSVYIEYSNSTDVFVFNGDLLCDTAVPPYYIANDPYFVGLGFSELYGDGHTEGGGSLGELIVN